MSLSQFMFPVHPVTRLAGVGEDGEVTRGAGREQGVLLIYTRGFIA